MQNPFRFTEDNKFTAEKDGATGTWSIKANEETWLLDLKWDSGATAVFELVSLNKVIIMKCVEASSEIADILKWKLTNLPQHSTVVKMTLKSHPGQALVRDQRDRCMHEGHEVRWYKLGDQADACLFVFMSTLPSFERQIIRLTEDFEHAMDCCEGKYHEGNEVLSWRGHEGGNQWFVVNADNSISPTHSPKKRWGINEEGSLALISED